MKIGFHSPLPPAASGVADYSAALLRALSRKAAIQVNAPDADVHLYHLGNNDLHAPILRKALSTPGVVVLHDAVLTHLHLGLMPEAAFVGEFVDQYGVAQEEVARSLWRERVQSGSDPVFFQYPMLKRVAERSRAVIVHNCGAQRRVSREAPAARVEVIPHLYEAPTEIPAAGDIAEWRRRHGMGGARIVFGLFGYMRESKRVYQILRAFEEVRLEFPDAFLLVAGQFVSETYRRNLESWLSRDGVIALPFLEEREFWTAAAASDVCLNLRDPSAGETSGIGIRMMGLGRAVIFTQGPEVRAYPQGSYLEVPSGTLEQVALEETMLALARRPWIAREVGTRAGEWIERHHDPELAASRYLAVLQSVA